MIRYVYNTKEENQAAVAEGWTSRKYKTAWYITWLLTALFLLPPLASFVLTLVSKAIVFIILPVEYYIPSILVLWSVYFGINLAQGMKLFGATQKTIEDTQRVTKNTYNGDSGGQSGGPQKVVESLPVPEDIEDTEKDAGGQPAGSQST